MYIAEYMWIHTILGTLRLRGIFDFTQIDHIILPAYQQIDLRTGGSFSLRQEYSRLLIPRIPSLLLICFV